jgi:hypothetical protein
VSTVRTPLDEQRNAGAGPRAARRALRRSWLPAQAVVLPCVVATVLLLAWEGAVRASGTDLFPGPWSVGRGIV